MGARRTYDVALDAKELADEGQGFARPLGL